MTALQRTVTVHGFHYIPADAQDLETDTSPALVQWRRLGRELPAISIYDVNVEEEDVPNLREDEEGDAILTVIQLWHNEDGDRSNITHKLRPEEWLVEDPSEEGGYRVLTPRELHFFLQGAI